MVYGPTGPAIMPGGGPALPLVTRAPIQLAVPMPPSYGLGPTPGAKLATYGPAPMGYTPPIYPEPGGVLIGGAVPMAAPAVGVSALPPALAAIIPAGMLAAAGTAYGLAQMAGLQFPWETGPGEGFISPFTRDIKQDESGRWVTRETRPDLWNGNGVPSRAMVPAAGAPGAITPVGRGVVKTWTANGWPFAMTADADGKHKRIHTVTKDGVPKSWVPYRSIVIGKTLTTQNVRRVATRIKSHVKSLKKVLSVLK